MDSGGIIFIALLAAIALWLWLAGRQTPESEARFDQWMLDEWDKISKGKGLDGASHPTR